jgi:hypothetical protein
MAPDRLSMQFGRTIRSKTGLSPRPVNQRAYGISGNKSLFLLRVKNEASPQHGRGVLGHRPWHRSPETLSREGDIRNNPARISFNEFEAYDQRNDKERGNEKRKED